MRHWALESACRRVIRFSELPGPYAHSLERKRKFFLGGIHQNNFDFDLLADFQNILRFGVAVFPGKFADMQQPFHSRLELDKSAEIGHRRDAAFDERARWIARGHALPWMRHQL